MNFTSPLFYVALVPATAVFYWLPGRWRAIYLLALSYAFYALSSRIYLVLLVVASAAVYALGLAIAKSGCERAKQAYMAAGVAAVVAMIVVFKAAGAWRGLLLPLGVSYYSFKLISYLIEVYWDDESVERDPVIFFLFPAFFPQIVSGPIQRPAPFFAQMRDIMGRMARRRPDRSGVPAHPGRTDDEDAGRRPPRRLHRRGRQIPLGLFLLGHADHGRLLPAAALCGLLWLYEHCARRRQAVRRRRSAQFQRALRGGQYPGDVAPLAYEPDLLADGLSVHAAVDVVAGLWPDRD